MTAHEAERDHDRDRTPAICSLEDGEYDENLPLRRPVMQAARSYIEHYTGLSAAELDRYEDVSIAFLVLCQEPL